MESREKINGVQRMQDYIEEHINDNITLKMLARASGYSPWYCSRIFKEMVGKTPFEYIRMVRLSQAALKLRDENAKVIDVAFDFVFDSHEGFTRAFSKQFGVSPYKFRKTTPPIKIFMPERIRDYCLNKQKGEGNMAKNSNANTVFVQVVDRPARKLMLKRGIKATHYFEYCEEVGCDIWGTLSEIKEAMYEPIGMWLPENLVKGGTSAYAQGVELPMDYAGPIAEGFEIIELKPCKMMIFQGQPYDDEKFEDAIDEIWELMKSYDPKLYGFEWADGDAPRFQMEPQGYRGYIEARPVRQI
ncbi:helix-turn-helix transcriptional regulator [Lutispora saccharofermentans]|uniref:AraC family transcriptional regulator n=1 Tax=Lutispora saccharofermentans TaxID=3024236 RepID=A0ABT1NFI6_9FIRM|nr:AraC family transcriptional regulator [Lutispora saccharofermentans]MCQ1530040.1 AraC family transcriptional regulator [Lutispora saccharofermentans]